jgi:hypothetical protein
VHHREEIFRVPERFKNRASLLQPFIVGLLIEIVFGAFLHDLAVPLKRRIFFAADFRDERKALASQTLEPEHFPALW